MLMVTTAVRMLDRVHGHTADLWPAVPLRLVLVISPAGFQHRLVDSATAGDQACVQNKKIRKVADEFGLEYRS